MGKKLFLFAAAAVALASCTETDLSGDTSFAKESTSDAIQFSAKAGNSGVTRATGGATGNITTKSLKTGDHKDAGFGVIAYHTVTTDWAGTGNTYIPNFMWNQQVLWNATSSVWSYTPVKFWPNDFSTDVVDNHQGAGQGENNAYGSQNGGKVSFFAYAPWVNFSTTSSGDTEIHNKKNVSQGATPADDGIVAITANDATKEPEVYYVLNNAAFNNAVDLLWGVRGNSSGYSLANNTTDGTKVGAYNVNLTKQTVSESVNFLFKHALSKIGGHTSTTDPAGKTTGLQVVLDVDDGSLDNGVKTGTAIFGGAKQANTLVTVKSIEIYDLKTANTNALPGVTETKSNLVKEGWFNLATGTWNATVLGASDGATYSSKVGLGEGDNGELNADIKETPASLAWTTDKWTYTGSTADPGVTTTPKDVYTENSDVPALVLIPANADQTLVVRVEYVVRTYDPQLANGANDDTGGDKHWTKVTQKITSKVTIPANSLKANTYYKLLLHLGLTSVKFTASVCDWEDAANGGTNGNVNDNNNNDKDVYLPSNTLDASSTPGTEIVDAGSVEAGQSKTFSAAATTGSFTITVTGLKNGETPTAIATGTTATATPAEASSNQSTITVALPVNSNEYETQTTTVTISGKKSNDDDFTTTVTLVQVPAEP